MMLEYRVPVSGISDAVDYPRTSASHTENCPTQRILSERVIYWLSKHARFSVEKNELFRVFCNGYIIAKFAPAITTYGGSSFYNEVGTCYCRQIRYLIVNGSFK